ncbi:MAG: non-hydrolyzing UDP-N-acetylglucosamine 2-epimerase, partial [Phycisphaerae bacterium]
VEAGLRSFDRTMPEEINRILTDTISDRLLVTEPSGVENLKNEGIDGDRVHHVGNVMIDTLLSCRDRAADSTILSRLGLEPRRYAAVTLHRPANVDRLKTLSDIIEVFAAIARDMPVVFPMHPRTRKNLTGLGLEENVGRIKRLHILEPLGYLDFLKLTADAAVVLTDSGGIQEETTILNVPCLTLRNNTERPITLTQGTNRLTGTDPDAILAAYRDIRQRPPTVARPPDLWDGHAAERIVTELMKNRDTTAWAQDVHEKECLLAPRQGS